VSSRVVLCVTPVVSPEQISATVGGLPGIGVAYLAAALEAAGVSCEVLDHVGRAIEPEALAARIAEARPTLVGFTVYDDNFDSTFRVIQALRARWAGPVVLGGYAPTFSAERFLRMWSCIDYVIVREGEGPLVRLVEALEGRRTLASVPNLVHRAGDDVVFNPAGPLEEVDALAWPKRCWTQPEVVTPILAGRGCSNRCTFCGMVPFYDTRLGPIVRRRDPVDVVAEMEACAERGSEMFALYDDSFPLTTAEDRAWCERFLAALRDRGLRKPLLFQLRVSDVLRGQRLLPDLCDAGLAHVSLGLESLVPRQLRLFRKRHTAPQAVEALAILRELPVRTMANVLFWDPFSTLVEAREHAALLAEHGVVDQEGRIGWPIDHIVLFPLQGTAIQARLAREGLAARDLFAFHRWRWDFADEGTRAFFRDLYLPYRQRMTVPRPGALWLQILVHHTRGQIGRSAQLCEQALRVARAEYDYFLAVLDLGLATADPTRRVEGLAGLDASLGERFRAAVRSLAAASGLG
jgi:hypothetical protein